LKSFDEQQEIVMENDGKSNGKDSFTINTKDSTTINATNPTFLMCKSNSRHPLDIVVADKN